MCCHSLANPSLLKGYETEWRTLSVIGYDTKTRRVNYLFTDDKHFVTRDGLRVGANIELAEDKIGAIPGGEIFGSTSVDGWRTSWVVRYKLDAEGVDGSVIDLSNVDPGRTHIFTIVGFEMGGV